MCQGKNQSLHLRAMNFSEESLREYNYLVGNKTGIEWDFTRCVRPDGTAYGTNGVCRKGSQEEKNPEVGKAKRLKKKLSSNLAVSDYSRLLEKATKRAVKAKGTESSKAAKATLAKAIKLMNTGIANLNDVAVGTWQQAAARGVLGFMSKKLGAGSLPADSMKKAQFDAVRRMKSEVAKAQEIYNSL
jgi:hypothetical protein